MTEESSSKLAKVPLDGNSDERLWRMSRSERGVPEAHSPAALQGEFLFDLTAEATNSLTLITLVSNSLLDFKNTLTNAFRSGQIVCCETIPLFD